MEVRSTDQSVHRHSLNIVPQPCIVPEDTTNSSDTAEIIDYANSCTDRLEKLYTSGKLHDVTLLVGKKKYPAHKLILANASDVFEQLLTSSHWKDSEQEQVLLLEAEECEDVFSDFLRFIYCGRIMLTTQSVLGLLVLADKYNIPNLKEGCTNYMSRHLVSTPACNKAVTWYQYAMACSTPDLERSCFTFLLLNLDVVLQSPDWLILDIDNLLEIIQRSDIVIESEYSLLKAIIRWLQEDERLSDLHTNMSRILPHIRFPMILPEELAQFEKTEFQMMHHEEFSIYLLTAYRYHALSARGSQLLEIQASELFTDKVPPSQFIYRNYTADMYGIQVDVVRKSYKNCPRVSSKVEKQISLPLTIANTGQEEKCKMKVTFYPLGYYSTSLWNGQLTMAKCSNQTKLVVAHRGGVRLKQADISVVTYAASQGMRHAAHLISASHTFDAYGTLEVDNVIDLEKLQEPQSAYVLDGALSLKVFLRPSSFEKEYRMPISP